MAAGVFVTWSLATNAAADPPKVPPKDPFADVAEDINAEMDDVVLLRFTDAVTGKTVSGARLGFGAVMPLCNASTDCPREARGARRWLCGVCVS